LHQWPTLHWNRAGDLNLLTSLLTVGEDMGNEDLLRVAELLMCYKGSFP
jgi:hypothetical protein